MFVLLLLKANDRVQFPSKPTGCTNHKMLVRLGGKVQYGKSGNLELFKAEVFREPLPPRQILFLIIIIIIILFLI